MLRLIEASARSLCCCGGWIASEVYAVDQRTRRLASGLTLFRSYIANSLILSVLRFLLHSFSSHFRAVRFFFAHPAQILCSLSSGALLYCHSSSSSTNISAPFRAVCFFERCASLSLVLRKLCSLFRAACFFVAHAFQMLKCLLSGVLFCC